MYQAIFRGFALMRMRTRVVEYRAASSNDRNSSSFKRRIFLILLSWVPSGGQRRPVSTAERTYSDTSMPTARTLSGMRRSFRKYLRSSPNGLIRDRLLPQEGNSSNVPPEFFQTPEVFLGAFSFPAKSCKVNLISAPTVRSLATDAEAPLRFLFFVILRFTVQPRRHMW